MTTTLTAVLVIHMVFAGLWTGGTLLLVGAVLPAARRGLVGGDGLALIVKRFSYATMASVVVLLLTGGHLAGTLYTVESLQSTGRGHLVLTMTGLWLALAGSLHLGANRLTGALEASDARTAVEQTNGWFLAAGVIAVLLLVIAGML